MEMKMNQEKPKTTVDKILEAILTSDAVLFSDQYGEAYIAVDGTGKLVLPIRSSTCRDWLAHFAYEHLEEKAASTSTIANVQNVLSGEALYNSKTIELNVRIARLGATIAYDLGKAMVVVGNDTWTLVDDAPIIFRRLQHQKSQVNPIDSGDINLLRNYLNLRSEDDYVLFVAYLVTAFIPGFPHPLLILHGPQGAGKTTPLIMLKELIDPSRLQTLPPPDSPEKFTHIVTKHHLVAFDNLSNMPPWLSDALARVCTGDGFSKRALYTDDDDKIYNFQRVVAINGIAQVVSRSDLLDRAIILNLSRIPDDSRIEFSKFWNDFEHDKPIILGGIFSVLSKAFTIRATLQLGNLPRMADFYRWGCAISEAMGFTKERFIQAYRDNIATQHDEAIEASPVALRIIEMMEQNSTWEGTATELLDMLNHDLPELFNSRSAGWPKAANSLSHSLQLLQPDLEDHDIKIEFIAKARPRKIILRKVEKTIDEIDASTQIGGVEGIFGVVEELGYADNPFDDRRSDDKKPSLF